MLQATTHSAGTHGLRTACTHGPRCMHSRLHALTVCANGRRVRNMHVLPLLCGQCASRPPRLRAREEVAVRVGAGPQHVGAGVRLDAGLDAGGGTRVGLGQRRRRRAEPHRRRDLRRGAGRPLEHDLPAAPRGPRLRPSAACIGGRRWQHAVLGCCGCLQRYIVTCICQALASWSA